MKVSVIEVGTNSTKHLLACVQENTYDVIRKKSTVNRLSSGMYGKQMITPEAMASGLNIIGSYIEESIAAGASHISIFSTSVLRDAGNRHVFSQMVKERFGLDILVISGEQEARLAYKACSSLLPHASGLGGMIDIGGGSTELTYGEGGSIKKQLSMDIGAVRLMELYSAHDLLAPEQKAAMIDEVQKNLAIHEPTPPVIDCIIGTGGTIKSIGTIVQAVPFDHEDDVNGLVVNREAIQSILADLSGLPLEERQCYPGLNPKRADVIVSGVLILLTAMDYLKSHSLTISSRGVIEGYFETFLLPSLLAVSGKVG